MSSARIVVLLAVCFLVTAASESAEKFDLRSIRWGMTLAEVKAAEPGEPAKEEADLLVYETKLLQYDANLVYRFDEGKLYGAVFLPAIKHKITEDAKYVEDYEAIRDHAAETLGKPTEREEWSEDIYEKKKEMRGMALTMEHLVLQSEWQTDRTEALLIARGKNLRAEIDLIYKSRTTP